MGCFDYTCAVSALPISDGTPVVALMIQQQNLRVYDGSAWQLRSLPVYGQYNDYGRIDGYEEGILTRTWTESLQHDLIEKGVGDNEIHDVGCRKNMTFADLLRALPYEDQVQVGRRGLRADTPMTPEERAKRDAYYDDVPGVPTFTRIEKALADLTAFVNIGEPRYHEFRIRAAKYTGSQWDGTEDDLYERVVQALSEDYATIRTCGSGNYGWDSEVLVRPKPNTRDARGHNVIVREFADWSDTVHNVSFVLVRRDVWDYLLSDPAFAPDSYETEFLTESIEGALRAVFRPSMDDADLVDRIRADIEDSDYTRHVPLTTALRVWAQSFPYTPEEEAILRKEIVNTLNIRRIVSKLRVSWKPRELVGDQHGDPKMFAKYHRNLAKLMTAEAKRRDW